MIADETESLGKSLESEVAKLISRHNQMLRGIHRNLVRYNKRSGKPATKSGHLTPRHWDAHSHFDPFYVHARLETFLFSLQRKIAARDYKPNPNLLLKIPKPDGAYREISIFSVPDAAVSRWLARRLIARNAHLYSSYSYAYRSDRNAHHAIKNLMRDIRGRSRVFILEYDFSKFFDSILHAYIIRVLKQEFLITTRELDLIQKFLECEFADGVTSYKNNVFERRQRGIPQGTNISLFLANVACYELDREIERTGASFARYADDTLLVCDSYDTADRCAKIMLDHGKRAGTEINFAKSAGIHILTPDPAPEIRAKRQVIFLGHELSAKGVAISTKAISRMKQRVARIIYDNLLLQPKRGSLSTNRVGAGFHDWDLVQCVNELRRYVYGRMTEKQLNDALTVGGSLRMTRCAVSFYPTMDRVFVDRLSNLDGWMLTTLANAYRLRQKLLASLGMRLPSITLGDFLSGAWYQYPALPQETRLPSFVRSWRYVNRCARSFGLAPFPEPQYGYA